MPWCASRRSGLPAAASRAKNLPNLLSPDFGEVLRLARTEPRGPAASDWTDDQADLATLAAHLDDMAFRPATQRC